MENDRIDGVLADWSGERPDLQTDALGIVLRIQTLAKTLAEQVSEQLQEFELEWWEYDALSVLRRQGRPFRMPATEIAESATISPGAMTNRIDRLENRKLVTRVEDPADRRRVLVQLSRSGRSLVDRATEARFASADAAIKDLPVTQQKQLDRSLRRLVLFHSES